MSYVLIYLAFGFLFSLWIFRLDRKFRVKLRKIPALIVSAMILILAWFPLSLIIWYWHLAEDD